MLTNVRWLLLVPLLTGCILYHKQRYLISRSKSSTPTWTELAPELWRHNGETELFVYRGVAESDLVTAAKSMEAACRDIATEQLTDWMHDSLRRHGLLDDLDQVESVRLAKIVRDVGIQEFERYLFIQDIYFEEYQIRTSDSVATQAVFYILASIPASTRDQALRRLASRTRQEKSNKFQHLAFKIERAATLIADRLTH